MFDDLHAYFYNNVVLRYVEYLKVKEDEPLGQDKDLRSAVNAATFSYHFREHLPASLKLEREEVVALCPDYGLLGDIVDSAKHHTLRNRKRQVTSADAIYERSVLTEYEDADGKYSDMRKVVLVKHYDGSERDMCEVLTNVVNFWGSYLESRSVLKDFKPFTLPGAPGSRFLTRAEVKANNTVLTQGLKWVYRMQFLRFNPAKGKAEPIDLSDFTELRFRAYKPKYSLEFGGRHESGAEFTHEVVLTNDQSMTWAGLETDKERCEFANGVFTERREDLEAAMRDAILKCQEQDGSPD